MAEQITLTAPDISCGHCVATVQKAVGDLPGVETVTASDVTKTVDITFDPGQVDVARISQVMAEEGYPVKA
jgi:copper chaperone CopZ